MKPSRVRKPSRAAASEKASSIPISRTRRWLFRFAAVVLVPFFFLLALEGWLRLAGFGHPTSFFLPMQVDGKECLVENDRFGWRFFGPEMARAPLPLVISKVKASGTTRVFVFGESAAFGDPQPEFGLCRILQALLEGRYPDRHFEVINVAMTAINSHVILPIARDCAPQQGDYWVIYMGNNEVVGPYGAGTVFGAKAANLSMVRAGIAFKTTRIAQALGDLARRAQPRTANQSEWGGMVMFQNNHVRQDDPRMDTVYGSFERNLNDIIAEGIHSGAKILVSTVARNLKDCGPFASDHRLGLSVGELSQWGNFYQAGIRAQQMGKASEAAASFAQSMKIDDTYAESHFRLGQCLLDLKQDTEAAKEFKLACDQDTLRFRADSRINDIIRRVATSRKDDHVRLVDSDATMNLQSPHGLSGGEFLYEHVHLNFEGNYLIARALAEQVSVALPANATTAWPTASDCARRLAWNDFTRRKAELEVLGRLNNSPFKDQADHAEQYARLQNQIEALHLSMLPEGIRDAVLQTKAAVNAAPDDWILLRNLAHFQQQTGDIPGSIATLQHLAHLLPQDPEAWQSLGLALAMAKRGDEAASAFEQAIRLHPESVVSLNSLAELHASEGRTEQAAREFQQVLHLKPYWGPAHLGLGKVFEAMGKTQDANKEFQEALKNRIISSESFNTLAKFSFGRGWYDASVTNFSDSLRLDPSDSEIRVNLGLALDKLGKHAEARAQFAEAVRLTPNFAAAHFCYGLTLGQDGDAAGAATQFNEAVRLKPDLIEARLNLGIALANQHLSQQALDQFDEVLRRDPNNQIAQSQSRMLRANSGGR